MLELKAEKIREIDSQNMDKVLLSFPEQVESAIEIGKISPTIRGAAEPNKFLVLGMGGSAIGGDLLRSYCNATAGASHIQLIINRGYEIPEFIDESWCVIASSYSGGTEETISGYQFAKEKTKKIVAVTSGGELEELANQDGFPIVKIPAGLMPRCAIGYSFFTMLLQLMRLSAFKGDAVSSTEASISELLDLLRSRSELYSSQSVGNSAYLLAQKLYNKIPVIYSAESRLDVVNLRWRGQIQENAKQLAFGAYLPEMNHNEINSWSFPAGVYENFVAVMLLDKDYHPKTQKRFGATESILQDIGIEVVKLSGEGGGLLTRMFDLIYLADWTSYWLAIFNKVDPTPIPVISKLKKLML